MPSFEPNPAALITSEMLRQDFIPDAHEALRIIHLDETETGKDTLIALGTAAIGVASSAGILALSGFTLPILAPLTVLGLAGIQAWNSRVTQRDRQTEADFLSDHPEILDLVGRKIDQGESLSRVAAALETAYRAYLHGENPQLAIAPGLQGQSKTIAPLGFQGETNRGMYPVGVQTQLGAIPVAASPVDTAIAPPETYPMANTEVSPDDRRALIARLREECPALLKLVKSHPIRAVGVQRSGKTTLVKRLALLRMVLIPGHRVIAATPHHEAANPYPAKAFKVVGIRDGQRDYAAIEREWDGLATRVAACTESSITTIWDEFGLFDQVMPIQDKGEDKIKTVLTSCLRETMKFGEFPIFIVHGETAAFLPGSKGLVTVFLGSTVRVEAIGEPVEDDMGLETIRPTGKFTVTWLDGSRDEGQIPAWLTEDYLLGLIGNSAPPPTAIAYPPPPGFSPEPDYRSTQEQPKQMTNSASPTPTKEPTKLDIEKPDLPMKEIMLQCSMLAEWIEERPGLSFAQKYSNYSAARKGFSRPQFRYLLTQIGDTDF